MDIKHIAHSPTPYFATAQPPVTQDSRRRPNGSRGLNYADFLTDHDRAVIFAATGIRVTIDSTGGIPLLAMHIGMDRKNRLLAPDQRLSVAYFRQLEQSYLAQDKPDPFRGAVSRAIDFLLAEQQPTGLDVSL